MFFNYDAAEDDWMTYECDSCGYQEEEQIYLGSYPCPECDEGWMFG